MTPTLDVSVPLRALGHILAGALSVGPEEAHERLGWAGAGAKMHVMATPAAGPVVAVWVPGTGMVASVALWLLGLTVDDLVPLGWVVVPTYPPPA